MSMHDPISIYLDDATTPENVKAMEAWLLDDADHVAQYALAIVVETGLKDALACEDVKNLTEKLFREKEEDLNNSNRTKQIIVRRGSLASLVSKQQVKPRISWWRPALAAGIVFALFFGIKAAWDSVRCPSTATAPVAIATIVNQHNALWRIGKVTNGSRLRSGRYHLVEGYAELNLRTGVDLILESPCEIELSFGNQVGLLHGRLTATVSTKAIGFQVQTPYGIVIDKGTVFGVKTSPSTGLETVVFSGCVILSGREGVDYNRIDSMAIHAGQLGAILADGTLADARSISSADVSGFITSWSDVSRTPKISGNGEFFRRFPESLRIGACESNRIQLFLEHKNICLKQLLNMGIARAGTYGQGRPLHGGIIPANTHVDVYLVHFDPEDSDLGTVAASFDFGRSILGMWVHNSGLNASEELLGSPRMEYEQNFFRRGVEIQNGEPTDDIVKLNSDRHLLQLRLKTGDLDEMRIVVTASEELLP